MALDWRSLIAGPLRDAIESELADRETAGFNRGWEACRAAIIRAAESLEGERPPSVRRREEDVLHSAQALGDSGGMHDDDVGPSAAPRKKRLPRGVTERVALDVMAEAKGQGLTQPEIVEHGGAKGYALKRTSVLIALEKLEKQGRVRRDGRLWFLVQRDVESTPAEQEPPDAGTSGGITGERDQQGGQNDGTAIEDEEADLLRTGTYGR